MQRRTKENLLYVAEDLRERFGRKVLFVCFFLLLGMGMFWGFQKVDAYLTPAYVKERERVQEEQKTAQVPSEIQQAHISIPKIGVEASISFVDSENPKDFVEPLKKGVAHYPSSLPGQEGVAIILGHSAPLGWLGNAFDGVFSNVNDLVEGDIVSVSTNGVSHTYRVSGSAILQRGQEIPETAMASSGSRLLLLSCWPPGIDNKRIMIQADKI